MNDAVTIFISGFVVIISWAILYVLWDNSCKKMWEFQKCVRELINCQDAWMDEVEGTLAECSGTNLYFVKSKRDNYEACKMKLEKCIKNH